ncbi:glucose 1-dehydrogenase [Pontivivens ytuae]|uniref:Glucose 1-dehydrogenase n=1 Tax=Pontivivens ytuae TaxID=2789856 RepID=A0A7S9LW34_9RHOB|nr:glucose 1-dehydrogenase [Pontivivens ytuae]QPH56050.1 glucose 1-dehydrogenase [Pontivivens ytuae]
MTTFNDKIVLITGATSGIGEAAAHAFAREGATVIVNGRRAEKGAAVVAAIQAAGGKAEFLQGDVSDEGTIAGIVDIVVAKYGRLDIAFNNAGVEGKMGDRTADQTQADYDENIGVNIGGVFWAMKHEIRAMLAHGGGSIVNTASIFSQIGMPGMALYTASKHAVLGLTRAASIEYAKDGIRINAVSPGGVETEMFERAAGPLEQNSEGRQFFTNFHPMGRISQPEEQAEAVLFLASEKASFVNGANLAVDSGWSIS